MASHQIDSAFSITFITKPLDGSYIDSILIVIVMIVTEYRPERECIWRIRRIATLEEVSAIACFLAGPSGSYMTGGVIDVSGGLGI